MKVVALLPARLHSTRIKTKLIQKIQNIPIILHTANRVKLCKLVNEVIVCTESELIKKIVEKNGFRVLKTKKYFQNGTERIASVIHKIKADLVVDVHADEALLDPKNIYKLINFHKKNKKFDIVVPHKKSLDSGDQNIVKLIFKSNQKVIYFSRSKSPYPFRKKNFFYHHLDIISFLPQSLKKIKMFKKGPLEKIEGIELLRAIENDMNVGTFNIKTKTFSINTNQDLRKAKLILKNDKLVKKYIEKTT